MMITILFVFLDFNASIFSFENWIIEIIIENYAFQDRFCHCSNMYIPVFH